MTIRILDCSGWQSDVDFKLFKEHGFEAVILRASAGTVDGYIVKDKMYPTHYKRAKDAGMYIGAYHFNNPKITHLSQAKVFIEVTNQNLPDFYFTDVENLGASTWTLQQESDCAKTIITEIEKINDKPIGVYSRASWLNRNPILCSWVFNYPLWLAYYTLTSKLQLTFEDLPKYEPPAGKQPWYPTSWKYPKTWLIWQWTGDSIYLPSHDGATDLNVFNGDLEQFKKWLRLPTGLPLPKTLEERILALELEAKEHGWNV